MAVYKTGKYIGADLPRHGGVAFVSVAIITQSFFVLKLTELLIGVQLKISKESQDSTIIFVLLCGSALYTLLYLFYNDKRISKLLEEEKFQRLKFSFFNLLKFFLITMAPIAGAAIMKNSFQ